MKNYSRIAAGIAVSLSLGTAGAHEPWWNDDDDELEIPFEEAHVFFELNHTDGDLGIHSLIDGGPWAWIEIEDPYERRVLSVRASGRLRRQGLTEIFFESAEPTFDELAPRRFFRRFPEGTYEVSGYALDGSELESEVELTHAMPAPPVAYVNGLPMALQCDDEEDGYDATETSAPVVISWDPVTLSHPDADGAGAAVQPPVPVSIYNYEVVVEAETEIDGEEFVSVLSVILPPEITHLAIPDGFLEQTDTFKYEVLAREESYNQTAVESCFELPDEDEDEEEEEGEE